MKPLNGSGVIIGDVSRSRNVGAKKVHPEGVKGLKKAVQSASTIAQLKAVVLDILKLVLREN